MVKKLSEVELSVSQRLILYAIVLSFFVSIPIQFLLPKAKVYKTAESFIYSSNGFGGCSGGVHRKNSFFFGFNGIVVELWSKNRKTELSMEVGVNDNVELVRFVLTRQQSSWVVVSASSKSGSYLYSRDRGVVRSPCPNS